jgi:hypothetical protein
VKKLDRSWRGVIRTQLGGESVLGQPPWPRTLLSGGNALRILPVPRLFDALTALNFAKDLTFLQAFFCRPEPDQGPTRPPFPVVRDLPAQTQQGVPAILPQVPETHLASVRLCSMRLHCHVSRTEVPSCSPRSCSVTKVRLLFWEFVWLVAVWKSIPRFLLGPRMADGKQTLFTISTLVHWGARLHTYYPKGRALLRAAEL